ncbi:MAG: methionyl-tRNA formyltransferase, partial [Defluviitaleaceae bacterium]|nr:methionyl-tRNA formyltransferase [Defluviitaleaceae bacterium]
PVLRGLWAHCEVTAVVTRPDAQKGRGHKVQYSPVKEAALERGLPVLQPRSARDPAFIEALGGYGADIFVVAAYGLILPESVLRLPENCVNVHASVLPKLRGAAPIQWAIINGEKTTGITIMHMDKKLDAGDMILKKEIEIAPDDTGGTLHDKLSRLGTAALIEALVLLEEGRAERTPQDHGAATYAPMLTKVHGHIDWNKPPEDIENFVRGMNPWPAAYVYYDGELIKVWRVRVCQGDGSLDTPSTPGEIVRFTQEGFAVAAGNGGFVEILEVQAQGARRMPAADYLRGRHLKIGEILKGVD